jgi:hypothetical protein
MRIIMNPHTQDTHPQDTHPQGPIDRFTLRIEEMRRDVGARGTRGPGGLVQKLVLEFFVSMFRLLAALAERHRNGTLPELAPPSAPEQPRPWPAELRPRESGWAESRNLWDPWGDSTQPEMAEPSVEQPAALPLPRRARARKSGKESGLGSARSKREDDGCWALWHGPGLVLSADAGFLRLFSKNAGLGAGFGVS